MIMLTIAGHSHSGLVVTSRPKELYDIIREFSDQVKNKADELKSSIGSKSVVVAVDLREIAEQADRDAARAMEVEPELDCFN